MDKTNTVWNVYPAQHKKIFMKTSLNLVCVCVCGYLLRKHIPTGQIITNLKQVKGK
jgi:hypothetical protein